jgi:hypothetical protein
MPTLVLALAVAVAAVRAAPERYYFEVQGVSAAESAPAEVQVKAKALLGQLLASRPEFVPALEGAPDPKADPHAYQTWLARHRVRAFGVTLRIDSFERGVKPSNKPGDSGQVLTVKLGLSLVGSALPSGALALSGSGQSTVMAEVGARIRPKEEEAAIDDALKDALTHAVDDAVARLRMPPPRKHR